MKKEQIKKLANVSIEKWKNRLGFSRWKINVKIVVFNRADGFPQQGDFCVDYSKRKATILIGATLKSSIEEIIVHELIHIMLWLIDQKMVSVIKRMPKNEQKRAEDDFLGRLEKVVDCLTKSFLRIQK